MKHLCDNKDCCGCFSCVFSCDKHAIMVKKDKCGFYYPVIDTNKCVNCGLCDNRCPILNTNIVNPVCKTIGARYKDINEVIRSTSGGIATYFAERILENQGVVYGVSYSNLEPIYSRIDDKKGLNSIRGTKYTEPRKDFWNMLSDDLNNKKKVLFIGTPCTIAAVKIRFPNFDTLYTCELVCHGITSSKVLEEYKEIMEKKHGSKMKNINLRFKREGRWDPPYLRTEYENGEEEVKEPFFESIFGYAFLNMSRESCYDCKFKGDKSYADITIGDYWGISEHSTIFAEQGVSLLLCRTDKGNELINFDDRICHEIADYDKVIIRNYPIISPINHTKENQQFVKRFKKMRLSNACYFSLGYIKKKASIRKRNIKNSIKQFVG